VVVSTQWTLTRGGELVHWCWS